MSLAEIPAALAALSEGKPVIVVDNESRENEGDLIIAAQFATQEWLPVMIRHTPRVLCRPHTPAKSAPQEWLAFMIRHTSGFICAPMTHEIADRLELPLMVLDNQDPLQTAYTITVDAADRLSTGISAADRAHTLRVLADLASLRST